MTAGDDDFRDSERKSADKRKLQDHDDFHNELAGRDNVSRQKRFLPESYRQESVDGKRKRDASELSHLALLMQNPAYLAAFEQAEETIDDFKDRMKAQLQGFETRIEAIDEKLEALGPDAIGTPKYDRLIKTRNDIQQNQQGLLDYFYSNIQPMEQRLDDPDNPPSREELKEFNNQVRQDMDNVFPPIVSEPGEKVESKIDLDMGLPSLG